MMRFFFSNSFRQASSAIAKGSIITGLLLIGFGMLVFVLRDIFAFLAAGLFFLAGISSILYGIRVFIAAMKTPKSDRSQYRENVNIHIEDDQVHIEQDNY